MTLTATGSVSEVLPGEVTATPAYRDEVLRLAKYLMLCTKPLADALTPTRELSTRAAAIEEHINANMSDYSTSLLKLFSLLLEEPLQSRRSNSIPQAALQRGCLVIPTGSDNDHTYPLNEIAVVVRGEGGNNGLWRPTITGLGNNITRNRTLLRVPSETEVLEFTDSNYDAIVRNLGVVVL